MQQKSTKIYIIPLISLSIFVILIFGAAYAYYAANTSMNISNYQITMPKVTTLTCSKTDCGVTVTPAQMSTLNTDANNAAATSVCSLNCTCSGTQGAICNYNISLVEKGTPYVPSSTLGSGKEFTAKVSISSNCETKNSSSTETQVNTLKDKIVANCTLTVPQGGSVSANVSAEFKWYNLNIDQASQASQIYKYQLTTEESVSTVTFDANGGTVSIASKKVTYGEEYGDLPEPTWAGHTFRGWNGKNKFNKERYDSTTEYQTGGTYTHAEIPLKPNTKYKMSVVRYNGFTGKNNGYLLVAKTQSINDSTWSAIAHNSNPDNSLVNYLFTTDDTGILYIGYAAISQSNLNTIWANTDVQIEEGTVVTPFEPYFITETTTVVQRNNHTLTAIWD